MIIMKLILIGDKKKYKVKVQDAKNFEKIADKWYETFTIDPLFLVPLAIAVTILAIICLIIGLFMDNANIKKACHSFTFSSVIFFLLLLYNVYLDLYCFLCVIL